MVSLYEQPFLPTSDTRWLYLLHPRDNNHHDLSLPRSPFQSCPSPSRRWLLLLGTTGVEVLACVHSIVSSACHPLRFYGFEGRTERTDIEVVAADAETYERVSGLVFRVTKG